MEAPAVAGEQVRYDMDQGYPQGYTQQEVEGKYIAYLPKHNQINTLYIPEVPNCLLYAKAQYL